MLKILQTNLNPSRKHLLQIEKWLSKEYNSGGHQFYGNWNGIVKSFENQNLITIQYEDLVYGFLTFKLDDYVAHIDICVIHSEQRRKGLGKELLDRSTEYFQSFGILVLELFCVPKSSQSTWKRLGFLDFPEFPHNNRISMFKPIVEYLKPNNPGETKQNKILLWECKGYRKERENPKYQWELQFENDGKTLQKPIIQPAYYKWNLQAIINGEIILEEEIERFPNNNVEHGNFLIIRELIV
ncbi:GNAT family N-acetyltransferase [Arenibacter aquaticus]|nr:GNAT family N-acetyltransferase [Arenibacter aquaticus]